MDGGMVGSGLGGVCVSAHGVISLLFLIGLII